VLLVAADQFRPDYLTRFGPPTAGFRTLMSRGAVFTDAHLEHGVTVTATGHATMLSGATPSMSGIIDNVWYERSSKSTVESVTDRDVQIVGGDDAAGTGRAADGAYFLRGGRFVTSTYYRAELPAWVADVNARQLPESYAGKRWEFEGGVREYPPEIGAPLYSAVIGSPAGNELVLTLAMAALQHERLGQRGVTDVLTVSFTSNDAVGHTHGPESPEVRDITQAVTEAIETALDARFGAETWIERTQLPHVYLDHALLASRGIAAAEARRAAAEAAARVPHVARVYTRDAILAGQVPADLISSRVTHAYHLPLMLMGPGIVPGTYHARAALNDLAPTLAAVLGVEAPAASTGRVLHEALQPVPPLVSPRGLAQQGCQP
jgi:hypothetical protein